MELLPNGSSPAPPIHAPLDVLGLSVRAYNAAHRAGVRTVGQLAATLDETLLARRQLLLDDPTPIDELGLSVRVYNALARSGITTVGALAAMPQEALAVMWNVGPVALADIEARLTAYEAGSLDLEMPTADPPPPPDAPLHAISIARLGLPPDVARQLGAAGLHMVGQLLGDLTRHPPPVREAARGYLAWLDGQPPAARAAEVTATGPSPLPAWRDSLAEAVARQLPAAADDCRSSPFALSEDDGVDERRQDVERIAAFSNNGRIRACPALLPDRPGGGRTFFESIIHANNVLSAKPTTERFLEEMITWAGREYPKSVKYYQNVLDAYYVVGLLDRTLYTSHKHSIPQSRLSQTENIQLLRSDCLRSALARLEYGRLLLEMAKDIQPFTTREMQAALHMTAHDASYHIRLFVSLGALSQEGLTYRLSPLAAVHINDNPVSYVIHARSHNAHEPRRSWDREDGLEALAYLSVD